MLNNSYYQNLKVRVDDGRLVFLSIVSPPRTGSTVLEKAIYNAYPAIAAQLNEPSSQIHAGEQRVSAMYQSIWATVAELEAYALAQGVDLYRSPLVLLTKNLFYYIGQDQEWRHYDELMAHHIVTVRHPAATFASYTKAIIETLEKQSVTLPQVIAEGADLSHIDWQHASQSPLRQHIKHMNWQRDYSSLGEGFRDAVAYQLPILGTRAYQQEIWAGAKQKLVLAGNNPDQLAQMLGYMSWRDLTVKHLGTALADIKNLPSLLREPIDVLRYGWTATETNMANIRNPSQRLTVVDYYDFLLDPGFYLEKIGQLAGLDLNGKALGHERTAFNLGVWEGQPNEEPFFSEVKQRTEIARPCKGPVPLQQLPAFLHQPIAEAFRVYLQILQSQQRIQPRYALRQTLGMSNSDQDKPLHELDPVHAYAHVAVAQQGLSRHEKMQLLNKIRLSHQVFSAYFDMVDDAVNTNMGEQDDEERSIAG